MLLLAFGSQPAFAKGRPAADKNPKDYKFDLDGDKKIEVIHIEKASGQDGKTRIDITRKGSAEAYGFTVPGAFNKLEVIDLNEDGYRQLAVYSTGKDDQAHLAVYSFKDNKLSKVFAATSNCGIETDFRSVLGRIKVGRQRIVESGHSSTDIPEWDTWVWSGERFIRE